MKYHLYQRTVTKNGKPLKMWYYWFYDEQKKQVRKSCGTCVKRNAVAFIENLIYQEQLAEQQKQIVVEEKPEEKIVTFNSFCDHFYDDDSRFIQKQKARGNELMPNTIYQRRLYLNTFLEKFGEKNVKELKSIELENWLLDLPLCHSVKNAILLVINEVYQELYAYELVEYIPMIQKFKRNDTKPKGILTLAEIQMLFPDDYEELIRRWRVLPTERECEVIAFATTIYTILSTGMRSCEVRALQYNQLIENKALLLNAMFDSDNERVNHLKKGDKSNKKWRVVVLPQKTIRMINNLSLYSEHDLSDFIFTYKGEPLTSDFLLSHFKLVLERNGIDHDVRHRNITIHSLRFTYNTLMRREMSEDDLRLMIGHASKSMTDYYDKSKALDHLPGLLKNQNTLDKIFN